jgi:2'-5' RNA ligase
VRLFFAVALPDSIREKLRALQTSLKEQAPKAPVGWTAPENIHLTLRFLGETDEKLISKVTEAARAIAARTPRFELVLEHLGTFGGRAAPRVVWVGVRKDEGFERLREIAEALEKTALELGFEAEDRPFAAHATLGRVRDPRAKPKLVPLADAIDKSKDFSAGTLPVERFVLYESRMQGPRPPEYVEAGSFPLAGNAGGARK